MRKQRRFLILVLTALILLVELVWIGLSLYRSPERYLNAEDASEMILAQQMQQEGSLLSSNWYYSTELRVLSPNLLWALLFNLSGDWAFIRALGTVCMACLMLTSYFVLVRRARLGVTGFALSPLLLAPFSPVFFPYAVLLPYYSVPVIIGFLTVACCVQSEKSGWPFRLLVCVLNLFFGMGGVRGLMTLHLPILFVLAGHFIKRENSLRALKKREYGLALLPVVSFLLGFVIHQLVLAPRYHLLGMSQVVTALPTAQQLTTRLLDIVAYFGFYPSNTVASPEGLSSGCALALTLLVAMGAIFVIRRRDGNPAGRWITEYLLAAVAVSLLSFLFLSMYAPRYYIPSLAFCVPVLAVAFRGLGANSRLRQRAFIVAVVGCFCVTTVTGGWYQAHRAENLEMKKVATLLQAQGYDLGYASQWNGNVLTELTNGEVRCVPVTNFDTLEKQQWLTDTGDPTQKYKGRVYLILTPVEAAGKGAALAAKAQANGKLLYQTEAYLAYGFDSVESLKKLLPVQSE